MGHLYNAVCKFLRAEWHNHWEKLSQGRSFTFDTEFHFHNSAIFSLSAGRKDRLVWASRRRCKLCQNWFHIFVERTGLFFVRIWLICYITMCVRREAGGSPDL